MIYLLQLHSSKCICHCFFLCAHTPTCMQTQPHTHSQSHHQKRWFLFVYLPINWSLYTFARPFLRGPFWSGMLENNLSAHFFLFLFFCLFSQSPFTTKCLHHFPNLSTEHWFFILWCLLMRWVRKLDTEQLTETPISWPFIFFLSLISFLFCLSVPKRRQTPASIVSLALTLTYLCSNQKQSICYFIISTIYKDYWVMTCIQIKQWLPFIIFSNKFSAY